MKKSLFASLIFLSFLSCNVDEPNGGGSSHGNNNNNSSNKNETVDTRPACEKNNTFEMQFVNSEPNPYKVYKNEKYFATIPANRSVTYNIGAGYVNFRIVQQSGYVFYPTEWNFSDNYYSCDRYFFSIDD